MPRGGARAHVDVDRSVVLDPPDVLRGSSDAGLFAELEPSLFLVDGNNLLWRAAHGGPAPFVADDGRDLTPVFRFFSMLRRALGTYGLFAECVVCFDGPEAWSDRVGIDPSYKANRRYVDTDLGFISWLPEIRSALESAGVAWVELADREADDVIATIAARAGPRPVRILSTDRDYYQLLSRSVSVVNPRGHPALVDADVVDRRYGVRPEQWCDMRAIAGDPSDGIPGVPGVGPKRAAELLSGGLTLEGLADSGRLDGVLRRYWRDMLRWRELIRLRVDVAVGHAPTGKPSPLLPAPAAVCRELGLIATRTGASQWTSS